MRSTLIIFALTLPVMGPLATIAAAQDNKQIVVESAQTQNAHTLRMVPPLGHTDRLTGAQLLPGGKVVLTASEDETLRLWDVETGREARLFEGQKRAIEHISVSPDGKRVLATSKTDGAKNAGDDRPTLILWDIESGQKLREWENERARVTAWLPDGKRFLTAPSLGGEPMQLWDADKGFISELRGPNEDGDFAHSVVVSPDGKRAAGAGNNRIEVWDVEARQQLRAWQGSEFYVEAVAIASDYRVAAADAGNKVRIWDAAGKLLHTITVPGSDENSASTLLFSRDGTQLWAGTGQGEIMWWNTTTGQPGGKRKVHSRAVVSLQQTPDNLWLTASDDRSARLWDTGSALLQTFSGHTQGASRVRFTPDGRFLLGMTDTSAEGDWSRRSLQLRELLSGRRLSSFDNLPADAYDVSFSPDGAVLASGGSGTLKVWNRESAALLKSLTAPGLNSASAFSADGKQLLVGSKDGVHLFDIATGQKKDISPKTSKGEVLFVSFLPGSQALSLHNVGEGDEWHEMVRVWDLKSSKLLREWKIPDDFVMAQALSPDGKWFAAGRFSVGLWDVSTGKQALTVNPGGEAWGLNFSADSSRLLIGTMMGSVQERVAADGELLQSFRRHTGPVHSLGYLKRPIGDALIWSAAGDDTLRLSSSDGKELLTYISLKNDDWLAYTPDGRFDGSPGGIAKVTFARGNQTFALEQFAERFYQPGLIALVLNGQDTLPTINAGTLLALGAPPLVKITSPQNSAANAAQIEVTVEAREQNKGSVKAIRLYHNGRLVGGPGNLRGIIVEAAAPLTPEITTQKFSVLLAPGENILRAVAYSQTDLESKPDEIKIAFNSAPQKPALHVLAVGINSYRDATMDLSYARPDAEALAAFFEAKQQENTLYSRITVTKLVDEAASGAAIRQALKTLGTGSKPEDVVLIYLAGHGETAPQSDAPDAPETFYFLPAEMRQMALKERVRQLGISRLEMDELVKNIAARKIVLVYDACKSGAAVGGTTSGTRGIADEAQALAQLARAQGIHILTASTAQQYAGEVRALGHGILTYALLEGLKGKATDNGSLIKVRELMSYVEDRVPVLAKEYRGREQWPVPFNGGQNFPLIVKP